MKIILAFSLMLCFTQPLFSQADNPVSWSFEIRAYGKGEYEVVMTATLSNGWYLFSQNSDSSINGAKATKIYFDENGGIVYQGSIIIFQGKLEEDGPLTEVMEGNMKIKYYKDKISFIQGVKPKKKNSIVSGTIHYTISNGTGYKALEQQFSFKI